MNRRLIGWMVAAMMCVGMASGPSRVSAAAGVDAFEQNKRLGRGVNVIGYDPLWRDRSKARFQTEYFKMIRQAGFNHVRINLHPLRDRAFGEGNKLSDSWLSTLDWATDSATAAGLMIILDFHEFTTMSKDPAPLKDRFLSFWKQVSERYKDRPATVLFEILNEPHDKLNAELWNQYFTEALAVIRATNPTRTVIIGPTQWNGIGQLDTLKLPETDRNIIATVHFYNPFEFTHQGAAWSSQKDKSGIPWNATPEEQKAITDSFDKAQTWSQANKRPLYLGEFGAYDKAEMSSRVRYLDFVTRQAEKRGWSWGYWQFDSDFVLYDIPNKKWIEPIRDALIPAAK
jgi:endoglucanase